MLGVKRVTYFLQRESISKGQGRQKGLDETRTTTQGRRVGRGGARLMLCLHSWKLEIPAW